MLLVAATEVLLMEVGEDVPVGKDVPVFEVAPVAVTALVELDPLVCKSFVVVDEDEAAVLVAVVLMTAFTSTFSIVPLAPEFPQYLKKRSFYSR